MTDSVGNMATARKIAEVVKATGVGRLDAVFALERCGGDVQAAVDYCRRRVVRVR